MARLQSEEHVIQGEPVDSINEWNVALALDKLNLEYDFQYYWGGTGVRGSQIIDFLVYTIPRPTPVFVHGEHWHTGLRGKQEDFKMADINSKMRGVWMEAVVIWGEESETEERALEVVRERLT